MKPSIHGNFIARPRGLCSILLVALVLAACSDPGPQPLSPGKVQGRLVKGPVSGAQVQAFIITSRGQPAGAAVASATTDTQGNFTLANLPGEGPYLLISRGGVFRDESDQSGQRQLSLSASQGLESILPRGQSQVTINPYTQALVNKLRREGADGSFAALIQSGRDIFAQAFGFEILTTVPADPLQPAGTAAQIDYAMALGGAAVAINSIAIGTGLPPPNFDAVLAFSTDLSDGRLDGLVAGQSVLAKQAKSHGVQIPAVDLNIAIQRFANNNSNAYNGRRPLIINETLLGQTSTPDETPAPNTPPFVQDDAFGGPPGQPLEIPAPGVLANDSDPDGDSLTVRLVSAAGAGGVSLNPDGSFVYTPNGPDGLQDSFSYLASDGEDDSAIATVSITLTALPRLTLSGGSAAEGDGVLVFNASLDQPAGEDLSVAFATVDGSATAGQDYEARSGRLQFPAGAQAAEVEVVLLDDALVEGEESFSLRLSDPDGVVLLADSADGVIFDDDMAIELSVADRRVTEGDSGVQEASVLVTLSENAASDVTLDYATADGSARAPADYTPASGSLTISAGSNSGLIRFQIVGDQIFEGDEVFFVRLSNVQGASLVDGEAQVTIVDNETAPGFSVSDASIFEGDSSVSVMRFTVSLDRAQQSDASVDYATADGSATLADSDYRSTSGSLNFPAGTTSAGFDVLVIGDTRFEGDESLTVSLSNPRGAGIADGTGVGLIRNDDQMPPPPATAPVANPDAINVDESATVTTLEPPALAKLGTNQDSVLFNDTDSDSDVPDVTAVLVTPPAHSSAFVLNSDGTFSYTHDGTENHDDSFIYVANDGANDSNPATVTITINPVNDLPVANPDAIDVDEGGTTTVLAAPPIRKIGSNPASVLFNDTDDDNDITQVSAVLVGSPAFASAFSLNADGTFSYTHDGSENFSDSFSYKVNDGAGDSNTTTVSVSINPVNDAPVANPDSINVDEGGTQTMLVLPVRAKLGANADSVLFNDTDDDNDVPAVTAVLVTPPVHHAAFTLNADGSFSYTHDGSENHSDSFVYKAHDGTADSNQATVTISVNPVNDPPVAEDDSYGNPPMPSYRQLTLDEGRDLSPSWDPRVGSDLIVFRTNRPPGRVASGGNLETANLGAVFADGSGEQNFDVGPNNNSGFGIAAGPVSWVGTTGLVVLNETQVFHEYLEFNTAMGPFTRTVADGADAAHRRLLAIPGGGGGGAMTVSRDGSTALWRVSSSGGGGTTQLRVAPYSSLNGQTANAVGTVVASGFTASGAPTILHEFALTPDGSQFVYVESSGTGTDLFLHSAIDGSPIRQLTSTGLSSGDGNRSPAVTPDGTRVVFAHAAAGGTYDLYAIGLDGNGLVQLTNTPDISEYEPTIAPDGVRLAWRQFDVVEFGTDNHNIWTGDFSAQLSGAPPKTALMAVPVVEEGGLFSVAAPGVLVNDSDPDGDPLMVNVTPLLDPAHGALTLAADGSFSYNHDGSENFSDSFEYEVLDGNGGSDTAVVQLFITPVNDAPTIDVNNGLSLDAGTSVVMSTAELSASDPDNSDSELLYSVLSGQNCGDFLRGGSPVLSFTQAELVAGDISFDSTGSTRCAGGSVLNLSMQLDDGVVPVAKAATAFSFVITLGGMSVVSTNPPSGAIAVSPTALPSIMFSSTVDQGSFGAGSVVVHGRAGQLTTYSATFPALDTGEINPGAPFLPGEQLQISVSSSVLESGTGAALFPPHVLGFRVAAAGTGTGSFIAHNAGSGLAAIEFVSDIDIGDLDGDGDLDLMRRTSFHTDVFFNDGTANFGSRNIITGAQSATRADLADLDGDGDLDLALLRSDSGQTFLNNGSGGFGSQVANFSVRLPGGPPTNFSHQLLADLDGDGDMDWVFGSSVGQASAASVFVNDGSGAFSLRNSLGAAGSPCRMQNKVGGMAVADVDNDGDLDLVQACQSGSPGQRVLFNDGTGLFSAGPSMSSPAPIGIIELGDLDGDGDADIVAGPDHPSTPLEIWLNDGSGAFTFSANVGSAMNPYRLALGDIDADGDLDIFVGTSAQPANYVFVNDGFGAFSAHSAGFPEPSATRDAVLGDVDGDGDLDIIDGNNNAPTRVYLNIDDPDMDGLDSAQETSLGTNPNVADTDSDGLNDGDEVNVHGTNPLVDDTDGDGVLDGAEVTAGTNPLVPDQACVAPPPGLLAWYRAEGDGTDVFGLADGTLLNGAATGVSFVGNGFLLDGVDDLIEVRDPQSRFSADQFTVEAWVRRASDGAGHIIASKYDSSTNQASWAFQINPDGGLRVAVFDDGLTTSVQSADSAAGTIALNKYTHVAATFDGATQSVAIYADGVLLGTTPGGTPNSTVFDSTEPVRIGALIFADASLGGFFDGEIDELAYYDAVLSAADIQAIFRAGINGRCADQCTVAPSGLRAWYPADGDGTDVAGFNHLSPVGGAGFTAGINADAFLLDGVDDHFLAADHPDLNPTTAITIDAWVYPESGSGRLIVNKEIPATIDYEVGRAQDAGCLSIPGGNLMFSFSGISGLPSECDGWVNGGGHLPLNAWSHVAVTYDSASGDAVAYVNGAASRTVTGLSGLLADTAGDLRIGDRLSVQAGSAFKGAIDEVEIFDRALSQAEIEAIYGAGVFGKCKGSCVAAPSNLVAWYTGDRNADDLAGVNHGRYRSNLSPIKPKYARGVVGDAFEFDGIDDVVDVPALAGFAPPQLTIDAWVRVASLADPDDGFPAMAIVSKRRNGDTGNFESWRLGVSATGLFNIGGQTGTGPSTVGAKATASTVVQPGRWYHVAGTYDGSDYKIYVDGVLEGTTAAAAIEYDPTQSVFIGGNAQTGGDANFPYEFNGLIDEVQFFERALSQAEIQAIFDAGAYGKCKPQCGPAVFDDPWDVSQMNMVTSAGSVRGDSAAEDLFGASLSGSEPGATIFTDTSQGTLNTVEWQTPAVISIDNIFLHARHDAGAVTFPPGPYRSLRDFRLEAWNAGTASFVTVYRHFPSLPFSEGDGTEMLRCANIVPFASDQFRATFMEQNGGPRILELDGFGTSLDSDGDGLYDNQEAFYGTNPNVGDTDEDGATDYEEVNQDSNPNSFDPGAGDTDPTDPLDFPSNDPPVNTTASTYSVPFGGAGPIQGLAVSDPDAGTDPVTVRLTASAPHDISVRTDVAGGLVAGDFSANNNTFAEFTAPISRINTTLAAADGVMFLDGRLSGIVPASATLTMASNDNGSMGIGGPMSDVDVVAVELHVIELEFLDGLNGFEMRGVNLNDQTGGGLDLGGDLNNDGYADLGIGSFSASPSGRDRAGRVSVVYGGASVGTSGSRSLNPLAPPDGIVINGQAALDRLHTVTTLSDINGDGVDDLLIGAKSHDPSGLSDAGRSYVLFGDPSSLAIGGNPIELSALNGTNGFVMDGLAAGDFASGVSAGGDINGDGIGDFAVAAIARSTTASNAGEVYLVFGSAGIGSSGSLALSSLNGANGYRIQGATMGLQAGAHMDLIPDVNGDGIDDFLIAERSALVGGMARGKVYLLFGGSGLASIDEADGVPDGVIRLANVAGTNGVEIRGEAVDGVTGAYLSGGGDFNGDGYNDFVIGAPRADVGGVFRAGKAYLIYGGPTIGTAGLLDLAMLNGPNGVMFRGINANEEASRGLDIRDLNGDGYAELMIGLKGAAVLGTPNTGEVYVIFGAPSIGVSGLQDLAGLTSVQALRVQGFVQGEQVKQASARGDFNADGLNDLAVGGSSFYSATTPAPAGAAYLLYGADFGGNVVTVQGTSANDDDPGLNGSAIDDVIVGGLGNDGLNGNAGADISLGGGGDDQIVLDLGDRLADGGSGNDTLFMNGPGTVDLPADNAMFSHYNKFLNFEIFALNGTLKINERDLYRITDARNTLRVDGTSGDTVTSDEMWTYMTIDNINGFNYRRFERGNAVLQVAFDIDASSLNAALTADADGDGLSDGDEVAFGTSSSNPDSDSDLLTDGDEVHGIQSPYFPAGPLWTSDPTLPDTDGDELGDGVEVRYNSDPRTDDSTRLYLRTPAAGGSNANSGADWSNAIADNSAVPGKLVSPTVPAYVLYEGKVTAVNSDYGPLDARGLANTVFLGEMGPGLTKPLSFTMNSPPGPSELGTEFLRDGTPDTGTVVQTDGNNMFFEGIKISGGDTTTGVGGGLHVTGGKVLLRRCRIDTNRATQGGGVYVATGAKVTLVSSGLLDNEAISTASAGGHGGGAYVAGTFDTDYVLILNNNARRNPLPQPGLGGGLYYDTNATGLVNAANFSGNVAEGNGGAVYVATGTDKPYAALKLVNSGYTSNQAQTPGGGNGGAIYASGPFTVLNSTFTENTAQGTGGGAIYAAVGLDLKDSTVRRNTASSGSGGGVFVGSGVTTYMGEDPMNPMPENPLIERTLFAANSAAGGPGGGLDLNNPPAITVRHSKFTSNYSSLPGAGLHLHIGTSGTATIFNNLFVNNGSDGLDGGGVEIENPPGSSLNFDSNTVAWNQLLDVESFGLGGGLSIDPVGSLQMRNNIIWFNDDFSVNGPGSEEANDNAYVNGAVAPAAGNNVNESSFPGNIASVGDPMFAGYYLDQLSNVRVDGGNGNAVDEGLDAPFTTDPGGSGDTGTVDIGFHHDAAVAGPVNGLVDVLPAPGSTLDGCGFAPVTFKPVDTTATPQALGPGQFVAVRVSAGTGELQGVTTLEPAGAGSRLAQDRGDGDYMVDFQNQLGGSTTLEIFVNHHPTAATISYMSTSCVR